MPGYPWRMRVAIVHCTPGLRGEGRRRRESAALQGIAEPRGFLLIIRGFVKSFSLQLGRQSTMKTNAPETEAEVDEADFKPLTAAEAQQWRQRNPPMSIWRIVVLQALVGLAVALVAWLVSGKSHVAWSAAYGALTVVVPAALFARGMARQRMSAGAALVGMFGWELVKIALTVAMLAAAPRLVPGLSWLALLVGMVVTMKTYWIALMARPGVRKPVDI